jgi:hypothetical protein
MASEPPSADSDPGAGRVTIGNVEGGIHGSILAGRDVIQKITNVFSGSPTEARERRNQLALLQKVKSFWSKGYSNSRCTARLSSCTGKCVRMR